MAGRRAFAAAVIAIAAGCGEGETARLSAGADWLKDHVRAPAGSGWTLNGVALSGKNAIEVSMAMDGTRTADTIGSLSAMEKGEIARLACPPLESEFWRIAGAKATVVMLLTRRGAAEVRANCRRP